MSDNTFPCPAPGCDSRIQENVCRCRNPNVWSCQKRHMFLYCVPHDIYYVVNSAEYPHKFNFPCWNERCVCEVEEKTDKKNTRDVDYEETRYRRKEGYEDKRDRTDRADRRISRIRRN